MADSKLTIPAELGREMGFSGTLIYNGIISAEEYNRQLLGVWGNRKYEIMRRSDSTIRGALQVVKLPVLSTTWKVDPVQEPDGTITAIAQEKADFCNRELFNRNINWHDTIRQALSCLDFGHSIFEKTYEPTRFNNKFRIGLKSFNSRKQVTIYAWETSDGQPGITQFVGAEKANIIREKLVYFIHDLEGENWSGTSLLRYVYKDWDIKDKLTLVNAMALEKLGVGVPVVTANEGMSPSPTDEADAIAALSAMRANQKSYLKIPNTMKVEMLDLKGHTTKEVIPTLNYHDARIMKSILAGFLELGGASGSGSQSLSSDLTSLFMKSEEALANLIVGAINQDLIKQLCDLNYADMSEGYPKLAFGQIADDDVSTYATAMANLTNAGLLTPDADIEDHLRGSLRLPLMSKEKKASYEEDHKKPDVTPEIIDNGKDPTKTKKDANQLLADARQLRSQLQNVLIEA
jgi:phage gp29-like protein